MKHFECIRRDHREEGVSIRELARRHKVHRRAVRQALAWAVPPPRKIGRLRLNGHRAGARPTVACLQ